MKYPLKAIGIMRKTSKYVVFIALIATLSVSLLVSCTSNTGTTSSSGDETQTTTYSTGYQIKFFIKDRQAASLGLNELHRLPDVTLTIAGKSEIGPTLSSVLKLAGINDFSSIVVSGMLKGRIMTGELTLKSSEINDNIILSYNNQGKTKLCGTQIPDTNWIIDVAEIKAE